MKSKYLILLIFFSSWAMALTEEQREEYKEIYENNSASEVSDDVWENAVQSFFSTCNSGSCKCVLAIGEKKNPTTTRMWIGAFKGGRAKTMLVENGGFQESGNPAPGSGWRKNYNKALTRCKTGNATLEPGTCCTRDRKTNTRVCGAQYCYIYHNLANLAGIPEARQTRKIYFASVLDGVIYLHENYKCVGPVCNPTRGCITINPKAMKSLCQDYIGSTAGATGQSYPEQGGAYLYFKNYSLPKKGSEDSAARGLQKYKQKCQSVNISSLGGGSNRSSGSRSGRSTSSSRNSGGASSQGAGFSSSGSHHFSYGAHSGATAPTGGSNPSGITNSLRKLFGGEGRGPASSEPSGSGGGE